jgi:hypothetical protein
VNATFVKVRLVMEMVEAAWRRKAECEKVKDVLEAGEKSTPERVNIP